MEFGRRMRRKNSIGFVLILCSICVLFGQTALFNSIVFAKEETLMSTAKEILASEQFLSLEKIEKAIETESFPSFSKQDPLKKIVNLNYKNAQLSSILRSLSHTYNLNLISTKDIKGEVSVILKDIELGKALNAILITNGYAYIQKDGLIYVTSGPELSDIGMTSCFIRLKYLTPAEAEELLQKVISTKGDIRINETTNSLVVTDFSANIKAVKRFLKEIDIAPIQVLIKAKLVEVTSKDLRNMGINWTPTYAPGHGIFGRETSYAEELKTSMNLAGPSSSLSGGQIEIASLSLKGFSIEAAIDALIQKHKAKLLASPSITTLNGKEARIVIGEKVPYKEQTQTTTGTTETTKFVDVGTTLKVTPQVSPDGYITMAIHPEVSSVLALLDVGPRITTREADCVIRIANGETVMIGGLTKRQDTFIKGHVPILGRIPILSFFFSNRSSDVEQTELIIFITPHIVRDSREVNSVKDREVYIDFKDIKDIKLPDKRDNSEKELSKKSQNRVQKSQTAETLGIHKQIINEFKQITAQFPENAREKGNVLQNEPKIEQKEKKQGKSEKKRIELEDLVYKTELECLSILNEDTESEGIFNNLVQLYMLRDRYLEEGKKLYNKSDWKDAISKWQKVLKIKPDDEKAIRLIEEAQSEMDEE